MDQSADLATAAGDPDEDTSWIPDEPPDWLFPEDHPPDPSDPATWSWGLDAEAIAVRADADGEEDAGWREAMLDAGIGTGWAHYPGAAPVPGRHGGPGGGFGQGQPHDTAAPEPRLAALADDAAGPEREFTGVGDDELMGLIGARSRLSSRQVWELLTALAELIRRRPGPYCPPEGEARMPRVWAEGTSTEVSVQLAITQRAATGLLGLAWDLAAKLPRTSAALRDGILDQGKAQIIASWCITLDPTQARAAEDLLFGQPDIETMTWSMIRDRIARAVMTIDPDAAKNRREQGVKDTRVETKLEQSGNMQIAAREIPPAHALALDCKLTARARALKKAGVKGTMSRLRVLAYLERWGIIDPFRLPGPESEDTGNESPTPDGPNPDSKHQDSKHPGGPWPEDWPQTDVRDHEHRDPDDRPAQNHPGDSGREDRSPGDSGPGEDGPGSGPDGGAPGSGSGPGGNGPDDSGNGLDENGPDGNGPGGGPDGGGPGRDDGPGGPGRPGGCGGGCARGGSPAGTRMDSGAGTGNGTGDAMAGWLHLTVPATTILDHADRAGHLNKLGPVDPDLARTLAGKIARHARSTICVTATGPDGRPVAHACGTSRPGDPATPRRKRRPGPPGTDDQREPAAPVLEPLRSPEPGHGPDRYGTWRLRYAGRDLDLDFETLTGPCDHRHQTPAHNPGKLLKHLTAILHQDCTLPTCRTPERRTDYEHAAPWPEGPTCWCNGHPCCRRNHRDKQAPGWHITGTGQPGWFIWTLPSGRSYHSAPTSYPT